MSMTLAEILDLTGILDVTPGEDTPRARFRRHLARAMSESNLLLTVMRRQATPLTMKDFPVTFTLTLLLNGPPRKARGGAAAMPV